MRRGKTRTLGCAVFVHEHISSRQDVCVGPTDGKHIMRFLLNIQVRLPGEWTEEQRKDMIRRETEAAVEFMHRGILRRTFRIVGQLANFSIWETQTPEELHAVLQSLPMYPYMTVTVTSIIKHPVEQAYEEKYRSEERRVGKECRERWWR